jgi:hypothetical protein
LLELWDLAEKKLEVRELKVDEKVGKGDVS